MANNYAFVPAYYEWHFIDTRTNEVLLNWCDPVDSLFIYQDEDGNDLDEPIPMDLDQVESECEDFINVTRMNLELENEDYPDNNTLMGLDELPANAVEIMANALYNYYLN